VLWKFVQLPEPIQNFGVLGAEDRYEGYSAERTELLKFIKTNNLTGVVFVAADIHGSVTNNLTYQDFPGGPQIATNAWEITTGSVAFDAPFGQTVGALAGAAGLLTPSQTAFYNSLPIAPDTDSSLNDKDDFIKSLINQQVTPLGYDPIGLNNNLAQANGLIDATLVTGDYLVTHGYGWTKFDVDATTSKLTVTTYGVPYYSAADAAANPASIAALVPTLQAQFTVNPSINVSGTSGSDNLVGTIGADTLAGGEGDDNLSGGGGNDIIDGGAGTDTASFSAAQSTYRFGFRDSVIVVNGAEGMDQLSNVEFVKFGSSAAVSITSIQGSSSDNGLIYANIAGKNLYAVADAYTGPVSGLVNQFLGSAFADIILGTEKADFINSDVGNDAINGGGGNDVIDGGLGSNFITGGSGTDKFFVDGRGAATSITWSTITDFSAGESMTIWGYKPGVSKFTWTASDGATGFKGVTLNADLDGNGVIDTSVTFSGLTQAQLPTPSFGTIQGSDYIFFG
jgi:hypothetical protein